MTGKVLAIASALLAIALGGCVLDRDGTADDLARPVRLTRRIVPTGDFALTAFVRIDAPGRPVTVYIEGDGLGYREHDLPSLDPTPARPVGLALAAADRSANVVYLARPCQYTPSAMNPRCDVPYWTLKRFAPEIITAISRAIDQVVGRGARIDLVGYSGGGAVAVLVAARRQDVASIRTVAGNLDTEEVNRTHKVDPMPASLNPIEFAAQVASIPQIHFSGGADETIPTAIAERFRHAAGGTCVKTVLVPEATHTSGWPERWPGLLGMVPGCG